MNAMYLAANGGSDATGALIWLALVIGYWVPAIVAGIRRVPNLGSVIVVNLFLGWTVIGWIVALAMACRSRPPALPPSGVAHSGGGWISGPSNPSR